LDDREIREYVVPCQRLHRLGRAHGHHGGSYGEFHAAFVTDDAMREIAAKKVRVKP
jgi:hypothetical protein